MRSFSPVRAAIILIVIACFLVGMSGRVAYLQTYERQRIVKSAERQQHTVSTIQARRGSVFDRHMVPMAGTLQTLCVYVDPKFMYQEYQKAPRDLSQLDDDLAKLAKLVDVNLDELTRRMAENRESRYWKIVENQSERAGQEVMKLKIPGVGLEPMCVRYYPMGSIGAHILGSVGSDGNGLEGLELRYQKILAGHNGIKKVEKDAARRPLSLDAEDYVPPVHGQHLVLTIDSNIQMIAEQELRATCEHFEAERGEVVVMDPRTGEVLALANFPTFDPGNLDASPTEARLNRAVVVPYEPGSTIKPFIAGPALGAGITHMNEMWHIPAVYVPYGSRRITDVHAYGQLCTWDVLVKSSNIGMSMLGERMGNAKLREALSGFGFGRRTGIELPGEDGGLLWPLSKWTHFSTESVSQGYELMVTPLQLCRAFCAYANGGKLVEPHVVQGVLEADGRVVSKRRFKSLEECPQAISPEAVNQMRQILSDVPVRGTAQGHASKVYNVYGKTGTSHIKEPGERGYSAKYNASFISAAPVESPRLVVAMVIHKPNPRIAKYGGAVASPGAIRLIERALGYLQVPASPELQMPPAEVIPHLYNFNPKLYHKGEAVSADQLEMH